jgi:hypothetical protein
MRPLTSFPPEPEYSVVTTLSMRETSNSLEKSSRACEVMPAELSTRDFQTEIKLLTSMTGEGSWIKENYRDGWRRRGHR